MIAENRILFTVVFLVALLVRGGVLILTPGALERDPDGYLRLAENLVAHGTFGDQYRSPLPPGEGKGEGASASTVYKLGGIRTEKPSGHASALTLTLSQRERGLLPTAFRPPLYPLLLTGCVALGDCSRLSIGLLHLILGVATVWLVLVLARWWGLGNRGAAVAALLVACDPILLGQSTQVMTETPATFLVVAGLAVLTWAARNPSARRMFVAGAILALGALCRPTLLFWTVLCGAAFFCRKNSREPTAPGRFVTLRLSAAFFIGVLLALSPWMIRNQIQFGRPIATTTHGGYTLLLANNSDFYQWLRSGPWGSVWHGDSFNADWDGRKPTNELQSDRLAYADAWQTIQREPGTFVYSCLVRLGRFWSPLPHQLSPDESSLRRLSRYAVATWYVLEFLLAVVGLCHLSPLPLGEGPGVRAAKGSGGRNIESSSHPSPSWLFGFLLVASLTAVHTVYWTDMRMRAPVMPVVALLTAVGAFRQKQS